LVESPFVEIIVIRSSNWLLGLKPLLVCLSYPPQQVTKRGTDNISNLINLGFDVLFWTLKPETWRKLIREGFLKYTNWAKPSEQAIISSVPQIALKYGIKLILWGENPGLQLGDMKTVGKNGYDGNNLRYMNTVAGGGLDWMLNSGFERKELIPYLYPNPEEFEDAGLQIVYLGWFWQDWSLINNGTFSCSYGLEVREDVVKNTGDLRLGRMSKADGITLVEQFDDSCSAEYIKSFCEFIDIPVSLFWEKVHGAVNKDLFSIDENGVITRKFKVGVGL